jgi:TonB-linked SusC/RagA family outer membrane protein
MSKRMLLFTCFVLIQVISFAQTKTVKGTVADENGAGLAGVSVSAKGSKNGTQTDASGLFSFEVPSNASSLVFSYVGFKKQTVGISSGNVAVIMEREISTADEVVVVGYQTVRRRDLTGSVSSVGARQIKDIPVNSAAEALTGRLAGVQLNATEGKPGAEVTIRVRGGGSITQDNTPLYIVDGIQVENALSVISPQDIENVDVLKDASATAIYGARGANGVVIITTKRGRNAKTTVNYNGFMGFRKLPKKLDVMNPYEFVLYQYERSRGNATDSTNFANSYGTTFDTLSNYKNIPFVDWQEEMFGHKAKFQTHSVSLTGGNAATQFNLGLTSNNEEGIMKSAGYDRKLVNFNFDHNINKAVKAGVTTRYNYTTVTGAGTSNDQSFSTNRLRHALKYRPLLIEGQELEDYDPNYALETNANSLQLVNPILYDRSEYRKNATDILNIGGYVNIKFTPWLSFKTSGGYDRTATIAQAFDDTLTGNSRLNGASMPLASITNAGRVTYNNSNVLTYSNAANKTAFSAKNAITVLAGHEIYDRTDKGQTIETRFFPVGIGAKTALGNMNLGSAPAGQTQPKPTSFEVTSRLVSFFGRVNYTRDNKYLLTLSARTDGSSKFAPDNRWSFFPSGSVAWRVSEEQFFSKAKSVVNDLKFRFSYGQAGNNRIADFLYQTLFNTNTQYGINDQLVTGYLPNALANPNLVWEKTISQNIGVDASFLNGRINFTADVYRNTTEDLLIAVPVPTTSGYTTQIQNAGSTLNKGVEFQLNTTPVSNKDFTWNANFNISFNKNTIKSLGNTQKFYLQNSGWLGNNFPADYIVRVGDPVGSMWGFITDGWYKIDDFNYNATTGVYTLKTGIASNLSITSTAPQPGVMKFKDVNGDSLITDADRRIIGNANPKFFGGLNQQFTYKNFDLSVFLNFQAGNDVYNANKLEFSSGYTPNSNLLAIMNGRWTNINADGQVVTDPIALAALNENASIWTPSKQANSFILHSWAIEDGSFLRINNVSLGYTLPVALTKKAKIEKLRIYGTVNNLALFTNYSGYDPEVSTRRSTGVTPGVDYSAYPRSRSFIVGVNLSL